MLGQDPSRFEVIGPTQWQLQWIGFARYTHHRFPASAEITVTRVPVLMDSSFSFCQEPSRGVSGSRRTAERAECCVT